jgi:hypothetical protein
LLQELTACEIDAHVGLWKRRLPFSPPRGVRRAIWPLVAVAGRTAGREIDSNLRVCVRKGTTGRRSQSPEDLHSPTPAAALLTMLLARAWRSGLENENPVLDLAPRA